MPMSFQSHGVSELLSLVCFNLDLYSGRVIKELLSRFTYFMETRDDSKIPADLQRVTFSAVRSSFVWRSEIVISVFPSAVCEAWG
jgi:hypothetical protein